MTTSRTTACDVYLSFAPNDHLVDPALQHSWVTGIASFLKAETASWGTQLTIAYDLQDVDSAEAWQTRRESVIKNSRILVPLLSPRYFSSASCMLEWQHYAAREQQGALHPDHSPIQPVMLEDSAPAADESVRVWQQSMTDLQHVDLQPWFAQGPSQLGNEELRTQLRALGRAILERLRINRLHNIGPGNVGLGAADFVGRRNATAELAASIGNPRTEPSAQATLTCLTGISGVGKTTLALRYASNHRHIYPGGIWRLDARHHTHVLPLLSILATDRTLGAAKTLDDRVAAGQAVLSALSQRASSHGPCLILLDDITEPHLLTGGELQHLTAQGHLGVTWLATTSLPEQHIADAATLINILPVAPLSTPESMDLIAVRRPDAAETPTNQESTKQLAAILSGYPVAVDLASAYLGDRAELSIADLVARLQTASARTTPGSPQHFSAVLSNLVEHSVAEMEPAGQSAAIVAAMCTAGKTPWSWVERCTRLLHPDLFEDAYLGKQNWLRIKHRLMRRGVLTDTDRPELARMHTHVQKLLASFASPEHIAALNRTITERVAAYVNGEKAPTWERVACVSALDAMVRRSPEAAAATLSSVEALRPFSDLPDRLLEPVWAEHLRWCDDHARKYPNNPQAQLIHATALLNAGIIEQSADASSATKRLQAARSLAKEVNENTPDPRAQRVVATATWLLSTDRKVDTIEEVVQLMSPLATAPDAPYGVRVDAAVAKLNLGQALSQTEPQRASVILRECVSTLRTLHEDRRHNPSATWALGVALLAQMPLAHAHESAEVQKWGQEGLDLSNWAIEEWPQRLDMVSLRGHTLLSMGNAVATTSPEKALAYYDEAVDVIEAVETQLPPGDKGHLVRFESAAAGLRTVCGNEPPASASEWDRVRRILTALVPVLRGVHPDMRQYCADALQWCQLLEPAAPLQVAEATATVLHAITAASKQNRFALSPAQRVLVPTIWLTVSAVQERSDAPTALTSSRHAIVDLQRESTAAGHNVDIMTHLSAAYLSAARIAERTPDVDSLTFYEQSIVVNRTILRHEPRKPKALRDGSLSLLKAAALDTSVSHEVKSGWLDEAVQYRRRVFEQNPGELARRELAEALLIAGKTAQYSHRQMSLEYLTESHRLWSELDQAGTNDPMVPMGIRESAEIAATVEQELRLTQGSQSFSTTQPGATGLPSMTAQPGMAAQPGVTVTPAVAAQPELAPAPAIPDVPRFNVQAPEVNGEMGRRYQTTGAAGTSQALPMTPTSPDPTFDELGFSEIAARTGADTTSAGTPVAPVPSRRHIVTGETEVGFEVSAASSGSDEPTSFPSEFDSPQAASGHHADPTSPAQWPVLPGVAATALAGRDAYRQTTSASPQPHSGATPREVPPPVHEVAVTSSDAGMPAAAFGAAADQPVRPAVGAAPATGDDFASPAPTLNAPAAPGRGSNGTSGGGGVPPATSYGVGDVPPHQTPGQPVSMPDQPVSMADQHVSPANSGSSPSSFADSAPGGHMPEDSMGTDSLQADPLQGDPLQADATAVVEALTARIVSGHALEATQPREARVTYTGVIDECGQNLRSFPANPDLQLVMAKAHLEVVRLDAALATSRALPRAVHAVGILEHLHSSFPDRQDISFELSRAQQTAGSLQQDYNPTAALKSTVAAFTRVSRAAQGRLTDDVADLLQSLSDQFFVIAEEHDPAEYLDDATDVRDALVDAAASKLDAQLPNKANFLLTIGLRLAHHVGAVRSAPVDAEVYCFVAEQQGALLTTTDPARSQELLQAAAAMRAALRG